MKWVLCVQWLRLAVTGLGLGLQSLHSLCQLHTNGLLKLIEGPFGSTQVFIVILLGFPGPSDGLRLHPTVFFSSGSGLTADSSVLTLTLAFLDFGLDFAQSFPFHAQFCHFGLVFCLFDDIHFLHNTNAKQTYIWYKCNTNKVFHSASKAEDVFRVLLVLKLVLQLGSSVSHATTRYKGKEIAKPITPPSESASEEDSDPKQAQRDKDMQKNLALIAKYFKKIYKPTNNNLKTSTNTRNKNVDTTLRKLKRAKDSMYHKEKMLLCKQAEKGVQLQVEQSDWLADTDEEIDEQELEAHYSYMAKIQEVPNADSGTDTEPLE
ncbi:hypothetical protein Tco_1409806 [Tanacetum coccineum]